MGPSRTARVALSALARSPLRAALTTFGIVIGVAAVIAMMEIGAGSSHAIRRTIATMGTNVLLVMPGTAASGGVTYGAGSSTTLTPADLEAILRTCPAVRTAAPIVRARAQVVYGTHNWVPFLVYGTTPEFLSVRDWGPLAEGRIFTERDVLNSNKVCVLGQTLVRELFPGEKPVGKEIRIKNVDFRVIGVLKRKGANMMGMDQDDIVLAPWTTIKYRVTGAPLSETNQSADTVDSSVNTLSRLYPGNSNDLYPEKSEIQSTDNPMPIHFANVDQILISARSAAEIPEAERQITDLLRDRHHIRNGQSDDFNIRDMAELSKIMSATTNMMTKLLLCIALISLIVGGVGIMNIMLVSVSERTREIGLRMAVGASSRDIRRQFLVEALTLCLIGGAIGILLGHGGSQLIKLFLNWPVETSPAAIFISVAVSAAVGVAFGYYPAWKASRLNPIEALRYE